MRISSRRCGVSSGASRLDSAHKSEGLRQPRSWLLAGPLLLGRSEVHVVRITDILCPIDFSEVSRHAFDRAVGVARCYDAVIHVLHVLPMSAAVHAVPVGPEGPGPFRLLDADRILRDLPG